MKYLLGQHLSERWFDKGSSDPLPSRIWVALRYLTVVVSVLVIVSLASQSPGGAFLVGVGGGAAFSGLLNVVLLPSAETKPLVNLTLIVLGAVAMAVGVYYLSA